MIVVGDWYFTKRSRRIVYISIVQSDRAYVIDVENPNNRGWIMLTGIDPKNTGINSEYNMRRWQPMYPVDEYSEN